MQYQLLTKKKNFIVVDFGTATNFDVIIKDNYIGGILAPGVDLSLNTLSNKASLIPKIKLEKTKSIIGKNSKLSHLSYIGDSKLGSNVNIGAGTITCNYDGIKKNKTKIKNNVFVGSNTSLVAPVKLEKKSVIGAGSVITKKVSKGSLALTRSNQIEVKKYKRKK